MALYKQSPWCTIVSAPPKQVRLQQLFEFTQFTVTTTQGSLLT